ncbi:MAG: hypothetical protein R2734_02805 [Nocardioides sp.]
MVDRRPDAPCSPTWLRRPVDVEAPFWSARAPSAADIGDNRAGLLVGDGVPRACGRGARAVAPAYVALRYPHGPVDAETLLADPRWAAAPGHQRARRRARTPCRAALARLVRGCWTRSAVAPLVTDGAFLPDGAARRSAPTPRRWPYSLPRPRPACPARAPGPAAAGEAGSRSARGARRWWLWVLEARGSRSTAWLFRRTGRWSRSPERSLAGAVASPAPAPSESGADAEPAADDAGSGAERVRRRPWASAWARVVAALGGVVARCRSPRS